MSITWLAGVLGVSEQKAYNWLREAKARGLIDLTGKQQEKPQSVVPEPVKSEREITLQEAHRVWTNGNDNVRDLAKALGVTYYRANQLYQAMVDAGLIEKKPKVVVRHE